MKKLLLLAGLAAFGFGLANNTACPKKKCNKGAVCSSKKSCGTKKKCGTKVNADKQATAEAVATPATDAKK